MTCAYFRPDHCLVERLGESSGGDQSAMHSNALKEHKKNEGMIEVHGLDLLTPEPGAIYVVDRRYSASADRTTGIVCDQTIALDGYYARQHYPEVLRRIRFRDAATAKTLVFLTNNFDLPALTIAALYKNRWQVELFFKWIKQHLRIKQFYGTS